MLLMMLMMLLMLLMMLAYDAFAVADATWNAAYDAWDKARDELADYLKEQDDEHSN